MRRKYIYIYFKIPKLRNIFYFAYLEFLGVTGVTSDDCKQTHKQINKQTNECKHAKLVRSGNSESRDTRELDVAIG